jgi:hypothetical protein
MYFWGDKYRKILIKATLSERNLHGYQTSRQGKPTLKQSPYFRFFKNPLWEK